MSKVPVFDIGDTLTPSRQLSKKFFRQELQRQGLENPPEYPFSGYNEFSEESVRGWLEKEGIDADAAEIVERYRQRKRQKLEETGALEVLNKIGREFRKPGIVSDNTVEAKRFYQEVFDEHGISIEGFVVSEEAGKRKPDREIFEAFLDSRGVEGEECVYFGNRGDIDTACRKVGMGFVWVTRYDTFGTSWEGRKIDELSFKNVKRVIA